jgi:superfamily II DNA or RNA helicase
VADVITDMAAKGKHALFGNTERDAFRADAVASVLKYFANGVDRCQGYAPTGSGKTHIAAAVWDGLQPEGSILVLVSPTRAVSQAAGKFGDYFRAAQTLEVTSNQGGTTDVARIGAFLADTTSPRMVFVTDSSLPRVTEALGNLGLMADLFVVDEAHRNTAVCEADVRAFWAEEAVANMPAARRLYMTATPRSILDTEDGYGQALKVISQDNADLFGPVAFDLPFDEAVRRGIVLPVAAYNFDTSDGELAETLGRPGIQQIWQGERMDYREIAAHLAIYKAVTAGLPSADGTDGQPYRPERMMVTFNQVAQAQEFVRRHARVMRALGIPGAKAFLYVGATPERDRQSLRSCVSDLTYAGRRLSHAVIAQCGALTEGFDLPDLDMTLLTAYGSSTIAVQQLIGRVTRLPVRSSKRWASVVTTDVNPGDITERPFYSVVHAMSHLSASLRHDLSARRETDGKGGTAPVRLGTLDGKPLPDDFTERLRLAIIPIGRLSWIPDFVRHLRDFRDDFGHVNVAHSYVSPDGYPLGRQVSNVRNRYADESQGTEDAARWRHVRALLDEDLIPLGFKWSVAGDWIPEFIDQLKEYGTEYGHANPPDEYVTPDGYKLGQRATYVRQQYGDTGQATGRTPQHRKAIEALRNELDALGFRWTTQLKALHDEYREEIIEQLKRYAADFGGSLSPPRSYVTPDGYPLGKKVANLRAACYTALKRGSVSPDRAETIRQLDEMGFTWSVTPRVMTEALVTECQRRYKEGETIAGIARALDISRGTVRGVVSGRKSRHVPDEATPKRTVAGTRSTHSG